MSLVAIAAFRFTLSEPRAQAVVEIARTRYPTEDYIAALDMAATDYFMELSDDEVDVLNDETHVYPLH